jgi:hypothetical protein
MAVCVFLDIFRLRMNLFRISAEFVSLNITARVAGFELSIATPMKSDIFWDITACSPVEGNRRFGGTYDLHLQGGKASQMKLTVASWLFDPEDGSNMLLRNGFTFTKLHSVISQITCSVK